MHTSGWLKAREVGLVLRASISGRCRGPRGSFTGCPRAHGSWGWAGTVGTGRGGWAARGTHGCLWTEGLAEMHVSDFRSAGNQTGLETLPPVFRASSSLGCRRPGVAGGHKLSGWWGLRSIPQQPCCEFRRPRWGFSFRSGAQRGRRPAPLPWLLVLCAHFIITLPSCVRVSSWPPSVHLSTARISARGGQGGPPERTWLLRGGSEPRGGPGRPVPFLLRESWVWVRAGRGSP